VDAIPHLGSGKLDMMKLKQIVKEAKALQGKNE
jgi:hypothetical protein